MGENCFAIDGPFRCASQHFVCPLRLFLERSSFRATNGLPKINTIITSESIHLSCVQSSRTLATDFVCQSVGRSVSYELSSGKEVTGSLASVQASESRNGSETSLLRLASKRANERSSDRIRPTGSATETQNVIFMLLGKCIERTRVLLVIT